MQMRMMPPRGFSGGHAIVGAVLAVIGVLAAAHPESLLLVTLKQQAPQLASCMATLITTCGRDHRRAESATTVDEAEPVVASDDPSSE